MGFSMIVPTFALDGDVLVKPVPRPHRPCGGACDQAADVLRVGTSQPGVLGFASAAARSAEIRRRLDAAEAVFVLLVWPPPSAWPFNPAGGQA